MERISLNLYVPGGKSEREQFEKYMKKIVCGLIVDGHTRNIV
jgi:hypothetical protein